MAQDTSKDVGGGAKAGTRVEGQLVVDLGTQRRFEGMQVGEIVSESGFHEGVCELDGAPTRVRWYPGDGLLPYWVRVYGYDGRSGAASDEQGITAQLHRIITGHYLAWYAAKSHRADHVFEPRTTGWLFSGSIAALVENRLYHGHTRIAEMPTVMSMEQQVDLLLKKEIECYLVLAELICQARTLYDLGEEAEWRYLLGIAGRYGVDLPRALQFTVDLLAFFAEQPLKKTGFLGEHTKSQRRFAAQWLGIQKNGETRLWEREAELALGRENEARLRLALKLPLPAREGILEALSRERQVRVKVRVTAPDEASIRTQLQALGCEPEPYLTFPHESVYAATIGSQEQLDRLLALPCVGRIEPMPVLTAS
jgi:hypothetical protein